MRCAVQRALCSGHRLLGLAIAVAAIVSTRLAHGAPAGLLCAPELHELELRSCVGYGHAHARIGVIPGIDGDLCL